ncbi:13945_t:CDS:1 [Racocetra fulgida]|uniref:13945_t:CDS:1 n=1 Tax=Racocetra fulgida TaxID=60492 RepID=A0A9N9FS65_9GLOM|nr:13945_t:CDS:1 [Racocetra fulgida]
MLEQKHKEAKEKKEILKKRNTERDIEGLIEKEILDKQTKKSRLRILALTLIEEENSIKIQIKNLRRKILR